MTKKVTFKNAPSVDQWLGAGSDTRPPPAGEPMKRFTIDVPVGLHTRIKTQCAKRGTKMADVIRDLLEREFPAES